MIPGLWPRGILEVGCLAPPWNIFILKGNEISSHAFRTSRRLHPLLYAKHWTMCCSFPSIFIPLIRRYSTGNTSKMAANLQRKPPDRSASSYIPDTTTNTLFSIIRRSNIFFGPDLSARLCHAYLSPRISCDWTNKIYLIWLIQ